MNKRYFVAATAVAALASSSALAADFSAPYSATPIAYQAPTEWTGFYAGVFAGVGGGDVVLTAPVPPTIEANSRGGLAGIQVGADYQFDKFVVGAVADIAVTNIEGRFSMGGVPELSSKLDYLGTLRARAGYLATDNLLIYLHGGLAYGRTTPTFSVAGVPQPGVHSVDRWGYSVGVGAEYAVTDQITLQTEYAYTDLGSKTISDPAVFPVALDESFKFHTLKAGVNFRF
ncbi:outer membrane protein [Paradevosia shaoguanensis]|uniref:outer membrane protein n=1 Tax=Paradevosia shaoguanensis TaxID=1335043 RepID=UPI00193335B3|nr:outer membrane protein [Paradevosia shaoguanensis]